MKANNENTPQENKPEMLAIEEHAKNMQVQAPVFTAVVQAEKWAGGKRVPETLFRAAVNSFLGAPMGGK